MVILLGTFLSFLFGFLLFCTSLFIILLILIQRGRGGGLTGALGGTGQSAFGSKAGDVFTRVTVIATVVWFLLCMGAIGALQYDPNRMSGLDSIEGRDPSAGRDDADEGGADEGGADEASGKSGGSGMSSLDSGKAGSAEDSKADDSKGDDAKGAAPTDEAKAPAGDVPAAEAPADSAKGEAEAPESQP